MAYRQSARLAQLFASTWGPPFQGRRRATQWVLQRVKTAHVECIVDTLTNSSLLPLFQDSS